MRVDFYQLANTRAEDLAGYIARNTLQAEERLLIVSADRGQLERITAALWGFRGDCFLANGLAGGGHDARQPILLSDVPDPVNKARFCLLADGVWREECVSFTRSFLLFDSGTVAAARTTWTMLRRYPDAERHFWKQDDGGRWGEAG